MPVKGDTEGHTNHIKKGTLIYLYQENIEPDETFSYV